MFLDLLQAPSITNPSANSPWVNSATWISALSALFSASTALLAVVFSRISNRATLGVSRIDHNVELSTLGLKYTTTFVVKNFGIEKVDILKNSTQLYTIANNQITLVYSDDGEFPYFQGCERLELSIVQNLKQPPALPISPNSPLDSQSILIYKSVFPMSVAIISLEYRRRGKLFKEVIKENFIYEIEPMTAKPVSIKKYTFIANSLG